ncbi:MAG: hypothetical protein NW201_01980 [Gemmatimonadales bacterium]|nr:hypothetical protein [Gemmatimonadales bacterium]
MSAVIVEAPARLHLGVLDLGGRLGRRFGGIGAAIRQPSLRLVAEPAAAVAAEGPEAERLRQYAERFLANMPGARPARLRLVRAIPAHAGLGSGTQLGLAVARAMATLAGLEADAPMLARAVGRGVRSAIGTHTFAGGGFILEGGRRPGGAGVAPLLGRWPMPAAWRYVVAIPSGPRGLSGEAEVAAFRTLPAPPDAEVAAVAHLVLMQLLPSLVEGDLAGFGQALTGVQRITGGWFARSQGGVYAPGPTAELVEAFAEAGAPGIGQSSWGPTAYAIVEGEAEAARLAGVARAVLAGEGQVLHGSFDDRGASAHSLASSRVTPD